MEYVELRIFCRNNNILCRVVLKTFCIFAKRILSKRSRKFFSIITKSPGLNHLGISAVPTGFHFQKQLLDFPSTIAHDSTAGPFKNHFSQTRPFFENKTLISIPHQTRPFLWTQTIRIGLNSAQRCTLYPLVRLYDLITSETRIRISFFPRTSLP
jgi:hypothetical protein